MVLATYCENTFSLITSVWRDGTFPTIHGIIISLIIWGTLSVAANSNGVLENDSDYYPYGGERVILQNLANEHYKFTGKERDGESNLDYFGARHYASSLGRFMTPEPMMASGRVENPQTWNRFSYVENMPTTLVDPDGLADERSNCESVDCKKREAERKNSVEDKAQNTTAVAATTAAAPTTMEEINAVVKPLVESAVGAAEKGGSLLLDAGETALGALAFVLTTSQKTADNAHDTIQPVPEAAHKTGERESTREKHEAGEARRSRDRGGEKGDARRRPPRKPPNGWKGPWPPKEGQQWW